MMAPAAGAVVAGMVGLLYAVEEESWALAL